MSRVRVFIDYQNVYHRARGAFGSDDDPPHCGNVKPLRLAALVNHLGQSEDPDRTLTQVRVYRGEPTKKSHAKVQSAFQRQVEAWKRDATDDLLVVRTRPLRYEPIEFDRYGKPTRWGRAEEKGIDVMIALDLVLGAQRNEYDTAVLISGDTDLVPAIDEALKFNKRIENAVWQPDGGRARPLSASGSTNIWAHRLTRTHFNSVFDDIDYAIRPPRPR